MPENQRLDIFKLHKNEADKSMQGSFIKAAGTNLIPLIQNLLDEIYKVGLCQNDISRFLAVNLKCHMSSAKRQLMNIKKSEIWISLRVLELIVIYWAQIKKGDPTTKKSALIGYIEFLKVGQSNSKPTICIKTLTKTLCKIAGAHAADGHINKKCGLILEDNDLRAVEAFSTWITETFGIRYRVFKSPYKSWRIEVYNKVIIRYLTELLDFPEGKKSKIVKVPSVIKYSSKENQKAFVKGVLTFDGSVTLGKYIALTVVSKNLIKGIISLLKNNGIHLKAKMGRNGYIWGFADNISKRWLELFEEGTIKHKKLKVLLGMEDFTNFQKQQKIDLLVRLFKRENSSKESLSNVIQVMKAKKIFTAKILTSDLSIKSNTALAYIHLLKKCEVIQEVNLEEPTQDCLKIPNIKVYTI